MCFGGGAAKQQAAATIKSAEMQAASDREVARAALQSMSTQIAQKNAGDAAASLLNRPQQSVSVLLAPQTRNGTVDPSTGRRKTVRDGFFAARPGAVLAI